MTDRPASPSRAYLVRFYAIVTLPAAALMALEIVSSRLLAPHFGNSVYVWGSIIGVFLATMSVGYWFGGRLADRRPDLKTLAEVLLASSVCQAVVLVSGRKLVAMLGDLTGGTPSGVLLATAVLFGPATVFLAMVSPFAVKIATGDLGSLGGTAGHLYALSTAGSLVGTLGATFVLIPKMALEPILATILVLTVLPSLLALGGAWRRGRLQLVLAAALLVLAVLPSSLWRSTAIGVLAERLSPYQTLEVIEVRSVRSLHSDGILHSSMDMATGRPELQYNTVVPAALFFAPEMQSMAVLGMGGGGLGRYMQALRPSLVVDHVEVDQAVADLAQEYLGFEAGEHHRLHVMDGRRFLVSQPDQRWDLIFVDTYIGHSIPFHLTTTQFYGLVSRHLTPGGVLGINLLTNVGTPLSRGIIRSIGDSFRQLYLFRVPGGGNTLLFATLEEDRMDADEIRAVAEKLAAEDFGIAPQPSIQELAGLYWPAHIDLTDALLLTDRYAPANDLLHRSVDRSSFGAVDREAEPGLPETGLPETGLPETETSGPEPSGSEPDQP